MTTAGQTSLSFTISQSLFKLTSVEGRCHPTISSSVIPFSSCPQSFPTSGTFSMSWLFGGLLRLMQAPELPLDPWINLALPLHPLSQPKQLTHSGSPLDLCVRRTQHPAMIWADHRGQAGTQQGPLLTAVLTSPSMWEFLSKCTGGKAQIATH